MNPTLSEHVKSKNSEAVASAQNNEQAERRGSPWWSIRTWWTLLKEAFEKWSADKAPRLGAALSYYTVFSLVPLLVLTISIAGSSTRCR